MLKLLQQFEKRAAQPLRVLLLGKHVQAQVDQEKRYWDRFLRCFLQFLQRTKGCFDIYCASVLKILRAFFNYLLEDRLLPVGKYHKRFVLPVPQPIPLVLAPERLRFLIEDEPFERSLPPQLQRAKDVFVFGCTVGLRFSDLMRLERKCLQQSSQGPLLTLHTQKTGMPVRLPLPPYAARILLRYGKKGSKYLLPYLSCTNLNLQVKELCARAGWTEPIPKIRFKEGRPREIRGKNGKTLRFCDQVTAHTMRRTAITTLLILDVPELVVRRLSGHAPGSREFFR
ncbi:MAG: hypothetical protein EOO16_18770, partial [Chitinophagaceae bacterium]